MDTAAVVAASAIRAALDHDDSLREESEGVRAVPITGKIALRGNVRTAEMKRKIEDAAKKATSGTTIENEIMVIRD